MTKDYNPLALDENQEALDQEAKRIKNLRETERDDFVWLMSDKRGRRIMQRMIDFTGVNKCNFTGNSQVYFNEGMRNAGLFMQAKVLDAAPEQFFLMLQEYSNDRSDTGNGSS